MAKNLIICSDGTGNEFGGNNTNVVATYQLASGQDGQLAVYDPGVGTGGWQYDEGLNKITALSEKATGAGVQKNVEDAYLALMHNYEPGDKVFLFGFSRGAFTVRSVAGMLKKVGLLGPEHENLMAYATKLYNTSPKDEPGIDNLAADFKATFSRTCPVHFIGVWDTVDSTILNEGKRFTDASLNDEVSHGYHAISIDEKREDFPVLAWSEPNGESDARSVQQVWFPGVHSDVGGWYHDRGLANGALRWMMGKAVKRGMKINSALLNAKFQPDPVDEIHESYSGLWILKGKDVRDISADALIHSSVKARMDGGVDYEPENLPDDPTFVGDDPID